MNFVPQFKTFFDQLQQSRKSADHHQGLSDIDALADWTFTEQEKTMMRNLPKKSCKVTRSSSVAELSFISNPVTPLCGLDLIDNPQSIYLGLVDILYAWCYNHRTTSGENTVESRWTIRKLSSSFSFLDVSKNQKGKVSISVLFFCPLYFFQTFHRLRDVIISGTRRSLTFPLYRHWNLSIKLWEDVIILLKLGKRALIRCFLEIERIFESDDFGSYHSRLYIQDYCLWLQSDQAHNRVLYSLAKEISSFKIAKEEMGYPLAELEARATEMKNSDGFQEET
jgi:hypothetical protein